MTKNQKDTKDLASKCPVCNEPLFCEIVLFGRKQIKRAICSCRVKEIEDNKKRLDDEDRSRKLDEIKKFSLIDQDFETKNFDNFVIDECNGPIYNIAKNYCDDWLEMKSDNVGMMFYGIPGIGKTFATACIANELISKGVNVVCLRLDAIVSRIYESYGKRTDYDESEILRRINSASLLILDDIGTEHSSKSEKEKQIIYTLIDARSRSNKPTICTTNLSLSQLKDKLTGYDGVSRSYDRLMEMCTPIKAEGVSRRVSSAREKREAVIERLTK